MFYLVERTDAVDYDEYDSFVVKADNKEDARIAAQNLAGKKWHNDEWYFSRENARVTELNDETENGVVLGSFNAG
jgi:hypothetical protein